MAERVPTSPPIDPESKPFFDAAREGRFVVPRCRACGKTHWYPRAVCPHCFSTDIAWEAASGLGTIHTFSPMRRVDPPYTIAYVKLDEGPLMMTNLVDALIDAWRIDQRVKLVFVPSEDGTPVPCFMPA